MKILHAVIAGLLFGVAAAAVADEAPSVTTITVTAKRPNAGAVADRLPPLGSIEIALAMPTDMPEAEIDFHMSPIAALPEPASRK